jgi:hypothetical protein
MRKSPYLYLRLGVVLLAASSWNQVVGQQTPYWINTFLCTPNQNASGLCEDSQYAAAGTVIAVGSGYCNMYQGRVPPLDVYADVGWTCRSFYTGIATAYPTPQPHDTYHYAVSSGAYFSGCSPAGYSQQACDVQYNYSLAGCFDSPC